MKKLLAIAAIATSMLFAQATLAAKVQPLSKVKQIPEKADESNLWERASNHENRIRNSGRLVHNREMEAYLESLTERLLGDYLKHLGITPDFIIVREPTLSAWAYPYGTIAVHTGLLVRMDNEAQFAAILAHEISHFLQRHSYKEMSAEGRQSALGKGFGLLVGLAAAKETGTFDKGIMDAAGGFVTNLATSGYSKKNEYIADEEGLVLMANAGLSRDEALPAFQALAENEVYGAGDPRKMWSSHPRLKDRLSNLRKELKKAKRKKSHVPGKTPDPTEYYRGIAPALIINARLDMAEQKYGRAREALSKYLMVKPNDPEAHFLLGESHRRSKPLGPDFSASMASYDNALQADAAYADAYKEIGMAHRIQRNNGDARVALEKYLQLAPNAADAAIVRAYVEGL